MVVVVNKAEVLNVVFVCDIFSIVCFGWLSIQVRRRSVVASMRRRTSWAASPRRPFRSSWTGETPTYLTAADVHHSIRTCSQTHVRSHAAKRMSAPMPLQGDLFSHLWIFSPLNAHSSRKKNHAHLEPSALDK